MEDLTRRGLVGGGLAALAGAAMLGACTAQAEEKDNDFLCGFWFRKGDQSWMILFPDGRGISNGVQVHWSANSYYYDGKCGFLMLSTDSSNGAFSLLWYLYSDDSLFISKVDLACNPVFQEDYEFGFHWHGSEEDKDIFEAYKRVVILQNGNLGTN